MNSVNSYVRDASESARSPIRLIVEQFFVENPDHAGARPGRRKRCTRYLNIPIKRLASSRASLLKAAVERRLSAASLRSRKSTSTPISKHTDHAHSNFGKI